MTTVPRAGASGRWLDALARLTTRRASLIALSLLAVLLLVLQVTLTPLTADTTIDSYSYHFAARAIAEGLDPYDTGTLQELAPDALGFVFPYLYPPLLAVLWQPLAGLDATVAHALFVLLNVGLAIVNAVLVWRLARPEPADPAGARRLAGWLAVFVIGHAFIGPLVSSVRLGQINVLLGTLVFGALALERRDRGVAAGICLGTAILIKLTPMVLLVDLVFRRRWRTLGATMGTIVALILATLPVCGVSAWAGFLRRTADPLPFDPPMSLRGLVNALGGATGASREVLLVVFVVLVTVLVARLAVKLPRAAAADDAVGAWSSLILFGLLAAPLTWHHHYYLAVLPFTVFTLRAFEPVPRPARWVWAALALLALLRYPGVLHPLKPIAAFVGVVL